MGNRTIHALRGVTLDFFPGTFVAVVGKSGSGKSTLLNLACGLDTPTAGTVSLQGSQLDQMDDNQLTALRLHRVGFVFQFFNLLPTLNAVENVALPARLAGRPPREAASRASDLLASLGLADRLRHYPDHLSGGEQQRVALARALINDPALILADEPTGNLDSEAGHQVLDELGRLARQDGRLVIMVTHSTEALDRTDRVVLLRDGRVVSDGAPGEIGPTVHP
jgi:putative ABC transport system ATP-binding protein